MSQEDLPNGNVAAAHDAGKNGWPSPKRVSSHNYHPEEERAWLAGMRKRCEEQYTALAEAA